MSFWNHMNELDYPPKKDPKKDPLKESQETIAKLRNKLARYEKLKEAAEWQVFYHPDDTIEMVTNALKDLNEKRD